MKSCSNRCLGILGIVLSAVTLVGWSTCRADDINRIEEDWQLVVGTPDLDTVSPQVTCTISPTGNLNSLYSVFDLNLRNFPSYEAGGVQLQLWNGDSSVEAMRDKAGYTLQTAGETITWTQQMSVNDGKLTFAVVNGSSTTWGSFGSSGSISITTATDLTNLNGYDPTLTVDNSGVGYGANRVTSLTLVRIRAYGTSGVVYQDTTPRVLYPNP